MRHAEKNCRVLILPIFLWSVFQIETRFRLLTSRALREGPFAWNWLRIAENMDCQSYCNGVHTWLAGKNCRVFEYSPYFVNLWSVFQTETSFRLLTSRALREGTLTWNWLRIAENMDRQSRAICMHGLFKITQYLTRLELSCGLDVLIY